MDISQYCAAAGADTQFGDYFNWNSLIRIYSIENKFGWCACVEMLSILLMWYCTNGTSIDAVFQLIWIFQLFYDFKHKTFWFSSECAFLSLDSKLQNILILILLQMQMQMQKKGYEFQFHKIWNIHSMCLRISFQKWIQKREKHKDQTWFNYISFMQIRSNIAV